MNNQPDRRLSPYLGRPAWVESEPPGLILDARVQSFVFKGRIDAINHTLDAYLNAAAADGLIYRAVAPLAVITFLQARLTSAPPSVPYGWLPDIECSLWVPVASFQGEELRSLSWFMPWVWVNSPAAMLTGYGVWGFAKSIGQCQIPPQGTTGGSYSLSTIVYDTIGPESEGVTRPLIQITSQEESLIQRVETGLEAGAEGLEAGLGVVGRAFADLLSAEALPSLALGQELLQDLWKLKVPIVNLKQFRDCLEPKRACYQAIVESTCTPANPKLRSLPGSWRMEIHPCASHPLVSELGLAEGPVEALLAMEVDMDFTADLGREVWRAGTGILT